MKGQEYLERYHGWRSVTPSSHARFQKGRCPSHEDRHPSFFFDTSDGHGFCWPEHRRFTLVSLINVCEFGDINTKEVWAQCYQRAREINGYRTLYPMKNQDQEDDFVPQEQPEANEEQRAILTAAMQWWHEQLWSRSPWSYSARGRRYFERERGVDLSSTTLRHRVQLGYAPKWDARYNTIVHDSFASAMRSAVGLDWQQPAIQLGLLWEKSKTLAIRDRVMLCSINDNGNCVFYQGREVEFQAYPKIILLEEGTGTGTGMKKRSYKYMSPYGIRKVPFTLAIDHPIVMGTSHTESPFGPAILAPYRLRGMGWLGCPPSLISLKGIPAPHWLVQDNDLPKRRKSGIIFYPGDDQAQKFIDFCMREYLPYARIHPPKSPIKDLDRWVQTQGIDPLVSAMLQHKEIIVATVKLKQRIA